MGFLPRLYFFDPLQSSIHFSTSAMSSSKSSSCPNNILYQIVDIFQSSIANDMSSAQLRVPSVTVRFDTSEQGKSETLRLAMRKTIMQIFCANCISRLGRLSEQLSLSLPVKQYYYLVNLTHRWISIILMHVREITTSVPPHCRSITLICYISRAARSLCCLVVSYNRKYTQTKL